MSELGSVTSGLRASMEKTLEAFEKQHRHGADGPRQSCCLKPGSSRLLRREYAPESAGDGLEPRPPDAADYAV